MAQKFIVAKKAPVTTTSNSAKKQAIKDGTLNRTVAATPRMKLADLAEWVGGSVVGRKSLIDAVILGVVARQNALFIGPPGTAKTFAVNKIASAFAAEPGDVFSILLTKFTSPKEVFGPVSIKSLENDEVHYQTDGYMPSAKVVIVDEVFKGSSAILNAQLQIANERTFRNGKEVQQCPTRFMVGMSNEFPEDAAILAAYFDRYPIKLMVHSLEHDDFAAMLKVARDNGHADECPVVLNDEDLAEIDSEVAAVEVPDDVIKAVCELRSGLDQKGVKVSDRRWAQSLKLIRAAAWLAGRDTAARTDLKVLELVCWNTVQEQGVIKGLIPDYLNPFQRQLRDTIDEVYAERAAVLTAANLDKKDAGRPSPDNMAAMKASAMAMARIKAIEARIEVISEQLIESEEDKVIAEQATASITSIKDAISKLMQGKAGAELLAASEKKDV